MKNQKGFSTIVIVIAIVAILVALGVFLMSQKGTNIYNREGQQQVTQTQQPTTSAIQNSNDLDATAADLDNTNVDELDNELNQMDADASTF